MPQRSIDHLKFLFEGLRQRGYSEIDEATMRDFIELAIAGQKKVVDRYWELMLRHKFIKPKAGSVYIIDYDEFTKAMWL